MSDQSMPGMSGAEFLEICKDRYPRTVRRMLTGRTDKESAMNAVYQGWLYRYLQKPVDSSELPATI